MQIYPLLHSLFFSEQATITLETIQSILTGEEVPTEMVVIDQSKTPNSDLMNFQPDRKNEFRYVWNEKKGISLGLNMAIASASHSLFVLTEGDLLMTLS